MMSREAAEEFSRHVKDAVVSLQKALDSLGPSKRVRRAAYFSLAHSVRGAVLRLANIRRIYPSYSENENTWEGWRTKVNSFASAADNALIEMVSLLRDPRIDDVNRAKQARSEAENAIRILHDALASFAKISQLRPETETLSRKKRQEKRR